MSGVFGVVSKEDCLRDLFYGTDYHSHLGTKRGGMVVKNPNGFTRFIHDITNSQFRSKFELDLPKMSGQQGIGVISDYEDQPLLIMSHLGQYAIVTVSKIGNSEELTRRMYGHPGLHFTEMDGGEINPTELVAALIDREETFVDGIRAAQEAIDGSCTLLILTREGIYAARDRVGRTPLVIGQKKGSYAVTSESCALPNLEFEPIRDLGPGEIIRITNDGIEQLRAPGQDMRVCAFLWIYFGYPASTYEGINVEQSRNRCGAALARKDNAKVDLVAGIPDSGTGHGIGYANEAKIPFGRPFCKYTPTWPRSFMPQDQRVRALVAKMKLIPIPEMVRGSRLLFCEDSIVRGTQLADKVQRLFDYGAREVHMRPACPPLLYSCKYLNFSRNRSLLDLATRKAIKEIEGDHEAHLDDYKCPGSERYCAMERRIAHNLRLTSVKYQELDDMIEAIGLPREKLCTYCWDGEER